MIEKLLRGLEEFWHRWFSIAKARSRAPHNHWSSKSKRRWAEMATRSLGIGIWEYSLVTKELSWSDEMFLVLGSDPNNFMGLFEDFEARVHPDDI